MNNIKKPSTDQTVECPVCHKKDSVILLSQAYLRSLPLSEKGIPNLTKDDSIKNFPKALIPPKKPRKYIYLGWIFQLVFFVVWFFYQTFVKDTHLSKLDYVANGSIALAWVCVSLINIHILLKVNRYIEKNIIPLYLKATHLWYRLYYCEDDDLVFDPVTQKSTELKYLRTFMIQETGYDDALYQSLFVIPKKKTGMPPLGTAGLVVLFMLQFYLIMSLIGTFASPVLFRGETMLPTIQTKSIILSNRSKSAIRNLKRGDIVVYTRKDPIDQAYEIGRIIGMPEETIEWRDDSFWIQNKRLVEPYLGEEKLMDTKITFSTLALQQNEYLVLSDNRAILQHDVSFQPIHRDKIQGKIYFCFNLNR